MSDAIITPLRRAIPASLPWSLLLVCLTILVQSRVLAPFDDRALQVVADTRLSSLGGVVSWVFRLGFFQVDLILAIVWSIWIIVSRRSLTNALPPLLIVAVVGAEVGLRLVIDQPPPGPQFASAWKTADNSIARVLDQSDDSVRDGFEVVAVPTPTGRRGTFPSGHASRTMFLALLGGRSVLGARTNGSTSGLPEIATGSRAGRWKHLKVVPLALLPIAAVPLMVSYTTLYFGYHWPSDILGGFLLALAIFPFAAEINRAAAPIVLRSGSPGEAGHV